MTTVEDMLARKGRTVHCIDSRATVLDALRIMHKHEIGALVVQSKGSPLRVFAERDFARRFARGDASVHETAVGDVAHPNAPCVGPHDTIERCMTVMSQTRLRHLPAVDDGVLVGLVSIGDVVQALLAERQYDLQQLHDYVQMRW